MGFYFTQNYGYRLQDIKEYDTVQGGLFCVETVVRRKENKLRSGLLISALTYVSRNKNATVQGKDPGYSRFFMVLQSMASFTKATTPSQPRASFAVSLFRDIMLDYYSVTLPTT